MLMQLSNHNQIDFNIGDVAAPKDTEKIRLSDLDYYSRVSFPPCMKGLFIALQNQHHLKHFGRLQLGLFLKGIGFSVDESLQFWKSHFTKKSDIDDDKFERNYAYNIRHSYGQEGKKNDYKPWNCTKIINMTAPGPGEYHGCPFKIYGEDQLRKILNTYPLTDTETNMIVDKKRDGMHQVACLKLFEMSHKNSVPDNVGNHPNSFFNSSFQYWKEMNQRKS